MMEKYAYDGGYATMKGKVESGNRMEREQIEKVLSYRYTLIKIHIYLIYISYSDLAACLLVAS